MTEEPQDILAISALFDIRLETLAATLLAEKQLQDADFDIENLVVAPQGNARRRSSPEVGKVKWKHYDEHEKNLFLEVHRKGLFDTLPEDLFLRKEEVYENPIQRTKAFEQQIKEARQFFLPFEQAMYLPRIESEQLEQKWTETFPHFIEKIWDLPKFSDCLDERQRFLLCYLIPEAYRIVGNWELTGLCFEAILQKPVNLNFIAPLTFEIPENGTPSQEIQLGEDAILGDNFKDDMPALEVCVQGITRADLEDYLEGGRQLKLLEELLYSYFLPLDVAVVMQMKVTEDAWGFTLGKSFLGYDVRLEA